jgi:MFS family permease
MIRVNAISFMNNFVAGALTLLIPLLLSTRNVDLAEIGLVLSILPIVFLVSRLLFAAIADQIGWSHILLLVNWPAALVSTTIYYVANSISPFVAGKIVEGLRESSYWAVNRTAIFQLSPKQAGREATRTNAIIWLATAVGSATAGVGIAYLGFSPTILLLIISSTLMVIPAGLLWKIGKRASTFKSQTLLRTFDPRRKGKTFWQISFVLTLNSLAIYPLVYLLLPVFMVQQMGYSYVWIGLLFMLYNIIASVTAFLTLTTSLSLRRAVIQSIIVVPTSAFLAGSGFAFPMLLCALAFVRGLSTAFFEHLVARVARRGKTVSFDMGLLHVPYRIAASLSVLTFGFVAQTLGYAPVFAATGIFSAVFSLTAFRLLITDNSP